MIARLLRSGLGVVLCSALVVVGYTAPAGATAPTSSDVALTSGPELAERVLPDRTLPLIDSEAGHGERLSTDAATTVDLGPAGRGHRSALLRVSVLSPGEDVTVHAGGSPALHTNGGRSASTTVLVPIRDGAVSLWGTASAPLRVEMLAGFSGQPNAPGSVVELDAPVTRADETTGLGLDGLTTGRFVVGLTGQGGVPSEGVRAVFVTLSHTGPAETISLGGQRFDLPEGDSFLSTFVAPDADGSTTVVAPTGSASVRVDVRGWVPEAAANASAANLRGGLTFGEPTTKTTSVSDTAPQRVAANVSADAQYVIALVGASATTTTTLVELDRPILGRGRGVVVDPVLGAIPQLTIGAVSAGASELQVQRGTTEASVTTIGSVLGAAVEDDTPSTLTIDSPSQDADVDLGSASTFTMSGRVTEAGNTIERVEIWATGRLDENRQRLLIGTAVLRYEHGSAVNWEFETSAPTSDRYTFEAVAVDRAKNEGRASVTVDLRLPDDDAIVYDADAWVVGDTETVRAADADAVWKASTDDGVAQLIASDAESLVFDRKPAYAPGAFVVGPSSPAAPDGYMRTVTSIDLVNGYWTVYTSQATIENVFHQVKLDEQRDIIGAATGLGIPDTPVYESDDEIESIREPGGDAGITVSDVDSDEFDLGAQPIAVDHVKDGTEALSGPRALSAEGDVFNTAISYPLELAWRSDGTSSDTTEASAETKDAAKAGVVAAGGIHLRAEASLALRLHVALDVGVRWKWGFIPVPTVREFSVVLHTVIAGEVVATVNLSASWTKELRKQLASIAADALVFFVGPVPVVIVPSFDLSVKVDLSAEARGEVRFAQRVSRTAEYGFIYRSSSGLQTVSTSSTGSSGASVTAGAHGKATIVAGPMLSGSILIYGLAGPYLTASAQFGATATVDVVDGRVDYQLEAVVKAAVAGGLRVKLPLIGSLPELELLGFSKSFVIGSTKGQIAPPERAMQRPTQPDAVLQSETTPSRTGAPDQTTTIGAVPPSWEEFLGSAYQDVDGQFIVNGDEPVVDESALRGFFDRITGADHRGPDPAALTANTGVDDAPTLWSAPEVGALRYCVSDDFADRKPSVVEAMRDGGAIWEGASSAIRFVYDPSQDGACTTSNDSVVFSVEPTETSRYIARAFFPNTPKAQRNVLVTPSLTTSGWAPANIIAHELGHALGFRHEHTRPEAGTCYEDDDWTPLTPYDSVSIMHYPQCNGGSQDLRFSELDAVGVQAAYGR